MKLLMAKGGTPHHGFAAFYAYLEKSFQADVVVHVGTHGAMEFMPGKQVGMLSACWPDRLIGELPNIYIYSVNNPSEGTIAKRRSYAEPISYLTPPIENAGLYKGLATMKDLVGNYRRSTDEEERQRLFAANRGLEFNGGDPCPPACISMLCLRPKIIKRRVHASRSGGPGCSPPITCQVSPSANHRSHLGLELFSQ